MGSPIRLRLTRDGPRGVSGWIALAAGMAVAALGVARGLGPLIATGLLLAVAGQCLTLTLRQRRTHARAPTTPTGELMKVERHRLPRIGTAHILTTHGGARIGVVRHRDERCELVLYSADDPQAARQALPLTVDEAGTLAGLLAPNLATLIRVTEDEPSHRSGRARDAAPGVRRGPPRRRG